ncbi:N-acetyl sugar amidotransferase [Desulfobacterales bacterium HSG17]|nr:N-acetyl sugar amidotransferase [Desulfobacterales bacterium HSG17]
MRKLFEHQPSRMPLIDIQLNELPEHVVYCSKCVTSNQRPRITFDEKNVCSACQYALTKENDINWKERGTMLDALLDKYRSKNGSYDVIVPSSGGKDSGYVAHQLKHEYGMHPLTVTWAPFLYTDIGRQNYDNFVQSGFDNIFFYPDGKTHRKLARIAFECNGDAWDPFAWGQKAFAFHMALKFNIPLVFYGENGELEYGGSQKYLNKPYEDVDDWQYLYFRGNGVEDLARIGKEHSVFSSDEFKNNSFDIYKAPPIESIDKLGVQMHWFSYYKKWIPQENYYYVIENTDFNTNPERSEGTYTKYSSIDDKTDGFHFWLGYLKFGMGRTTRDASMEVRSNHITREEAVALVKRFDGEFPKKHFLEFLQYLDINEDLFWEITDKLRPSHIWEKSNNKWQLKHELC